MFMGLNAHFLLLLCVKLTMNVIIIESLLKVKKKKLFFSICEKNNRCRITLFKKWDGQNGFPALSVIWFCELK
jgi:hypothetical protein